MSIKSAVKQALYTALLGDYEELNELPDLAGDIDAYCFTDNHLLKSKTWKIIYISPEFPLDPIRSQRMIKVLGHPILDEYDQTLYIDNSVYLKSSPKKILDDWLKDYDIAFPDHSFRETVGDEFEEVLKGKLDSRERITEQLEHYSKNYPEALLAKPFWNAIIARKKTDQNLLFNRTWANHILRYSRRDQLSHSAAMQITQTKINRVIIDNYSSQIHEWPVRKISNHHVRTSSIPDYFEQLQIAETNIRYYQEEIVKIKKTFSWRVTTPIRYIGTLIKR